MAYKKINFPQINSFDMQISFVEIDALSPLNVYDSHMHEEYEIYINLSGDVSFAVEERIYPVVPGTVIVTRPYEYHHCIYHSNEIHRHIWILISSGGNEDLFQSLFRRAPEAGNALRLGKSQTDEVLQVCRRLSESTSTAEKYRLFLRFFGLLTSVKNEDISYPTKEDDVTKAIMLLNRDPDLSVGELARQCHVSINTLERNFKKALHVSPSVYIKKKRLANATKLLNAGYSVTEAAERSGFSDCSNFISTFKKFYHITPLRYKKQLSEKRTV